MTVLCDHVVARSLVNAESDFSNGNGIYREVALVPELRSSIFEACAERSEQVRAFATSQRLTELASDVNRVPRVESPRRARNGNSRLVSHVLPNKNQGLKEIIYGSHSFRSVAKHEKV
jgi:hypothetical protein